MPTLSLVRDPRERSVVCGAQSEGKRGRRHRKGGGGGGRGRRRELHEGTRRCVGCGERFAWSEERASVLRIAVVKAPGSGHWQAHIDLGRSSFGRGAWCHARIPCLKRAVERGLHASVKGRVDVTLPGLEAEIAHQARRRLGSLLRSASRAGVLAIGADAVRDAVQANPNDGPLILVASDAKAGAEIPEVRAASSAGRVQVVGTKNELGEALNRTAVAVVAVLRGELAGQLTEALSLIATFAPRAPSAETIDEERTAAPTA
ncbi:MAG: DUF448 domain-containing protein [Myxococcota bacterium]